MEIKYVTQRWKREDFPSQTECTGLGTKSVQRLQKQKIQPLFKVFIRFEKSLAKNSIEILGVLVTIKYHHSLLKPTLSSELLSHTYQDMSEKYYLIDISHCQFNSAR